MSFGGLTPELLYNTPPKALALGVVTRGRRSSPSRCPVAQFRHPALPTHPVHRPGVWRARATRHRDVTTLLHYHLCWTGRDI